MPTDVRLPDGRTVTVQTDDPKAAAAAARKYLAANPPKKAPAKDPWYGKPKKALPKPPPKKAKSKGFWGTVADFAGDVTDNVLPNWGDEVAGFGGGVASLIKGRPYREGYQNQSERFRRDQAQYDEEHPALAWGSTITGQGMGILAPAGKVASGATLAKKAKTGAAVGALYGAAAGAGEGDGLQERATNAAVGAGFGGTVGAALPPALDLGGKGVRWARQSIPGADTAIRAITAVPRAVWSKASGKPLPPAAEDQAHGMLADRMGEGNIALGNGEIGPAATPRRIAEEVARRNAAGVPAMLGDVTESMRDVTEFASRGIGPGQSMVRQAIERRKALEPLRVRQHVQETFPTVSDPVRFDQDASRAAKDAAAPLYAAAYAQPVYRTPGMQVIEQAPAFRDALPIAYRNIQNQIDPATGQLKSPAAFGFRWFDGDPNGLPPNVPHFPHPSGRGFVALEEGLSTEGYDQVIRAMDDSARAAGNLNPLTGRVEDTTNSVHISSLARSLREELAAQNASYRQAAGDYGDAMAYRGAFRSGQDVGKLSGHEINAQQRSMPAFAQDAWTTGAGTAMADHASEYGARYPNGATANAVRQMLGDDIKQTAIGEMAGNTGGVRQLLDQLEYEQQGHLNWQRVNAGSRTAQRQQLDADLESSISIPTSTVEMVRRMVGFMVSRAAPQFRQDVKARLAEVVTASNAQTVEEALRAIEDKVARDRHFRHLLHKAGIATTKAYGMNLQPVEPSDD